jgi:hypothetical protein
MSGWISFNDLMTQIEVVAHRNQETPGLDVLFDRMVASCVVAQPEEVLSEKTGAFASYGHAVIYEQTNAPGNPYHRHEDNCGPFCDGWILTATPDGFVVEKIGDATKSMSFSHEEPWPERVQHFLRRTYWRPLDFSRLL